MKALTDRPPRTPPQYSEGLAGLGDDPRHVGERLDVVDDRGLQVQPLRRREERRLQARHAALALEALDERCLLPDDVGARTPRQRDVHGEVGAEDVAAHEVVGVGVVERLGDALLRERHLPAHVQERLRRADRVGGDHDALDQLVRVALHQQPVLVGARLALVAVDDEVAREHARRQEPPLRARREPGTATALHLRRLDLGVHLLGGHLRQRLAERGVPAGADVPVVGVRVRHVEARGHEPRTGRHEPGHVERRCVGHGALLIGRPPRPAHGGRCRPSSVRSAGARGPASRAAGSRPAGDRPRDRRPGGRSRPATPCSGS
jgi:hypothetical protein